MAINQLGEERKCFYCSSSISNWKEKLKKRFNLSEWHFLKSRGTHAIFFGMYNPVDYIRFLWHNGKKTVFWCGGDVLNLKRRPIWQKILNLPNAKHISENQVEHDALFVMGIESKIAPCLFGNMDGIEICYKHSDNPRVFGVYHKGREKEYGVFDHPQVDWLCGLSEKEFNEKIKSYQGCIRMNDFDGFSEILARSALMGQYQYSVIPYDYMAGPDHILLEDWINNLKHNKEPNYEGAEYWRNKLTESLNEILT